MDEIEVGWGSEGGRRLIGAQRKEGPYNNATEKEFQKRRKKIAELPSLCILY